MNDELELIGLHMLRTLPRAWVYDVMRWAGTRQGFRLLLLMWRAAEDDTERAAIVVSLQELLDDRETSPRSVPTDSKAAFAKEYAERCAFKAHLRRLIDEHGGVSEVARKAEMPQPSLSRLLTSAAAPRTATLVRLAQAMGISVSRLSPMPNEDAEVFDLTEHLRGPYRLRRVVERTLARASG